MNFARRNIGAARAGLAILVILLNAMVLAAMLVVEVPAGNRDILLLVVGGLVNATGAIVGYYFGSASARGRVNGG